MGKVALGKSPMLARYKSRLGFICGKFEADFWYYELLEMTRKTMLMAVASFIQQGGFLAIFANLFRSSPFNSDKVDMLVTTSQLCTLATLFFALMMKIGFFEEEGVPKDVMGQILIYIMFLPMVLAVYIVGNALHETLFTKCLQGCGFGFTKTVRFIKMSGRFLDKHIRLD